MQVGIITISGRQIGVIMQTEYVADTYTPALSGDAGYGGNTMLDEGGEVGAGGGSGHAPPGVRRRASRGNAERRGDGPRSDGPKSTDGMDAYEGSLPEKRRPPKDERDIPYSGGTGHPFDRERFSQELATNPELREKVKRLSLGENQDPTANLAVIESMMNRAVTRGTTLEKQARRHRQSGKDEGGYYAGYAQSYSPEKGEMAERNIDKALRGSNVTNYATDNASSWLAEKNKRTGRFTPHRDFNRESFFSPGSAEPVLRDRWQRLNKRAKEFENPDPSIDGIAPPSMGKASDKISSAATKVRVADAPDGEDKK